MHRVFQNFIDGLAESADAADLQSVLAQAGCALDVGRFAYLSLPFRSADRPQVISTYPADWVERYLSRHYERIDPVMLDALGAAKPFEWARESSSRSLSKDQHALLDEAALFGIRCGFTVPIHGSRGPIATVTFAADERRATFQRCMKYNKCVLQLMAMSFHAHVRMKLMPERVVDGISLSSREFECLQWAARGKSAWEIGCLLNISRRTVAFHLDNAKAKLDVRTLYQAVAKYAETTCKRKWAQPVDPCAIRQDEESPNNRL